MDYTDGSVLWLDNHIIIPCKIDIDPIGYILVELKYPFFRDTVLRKSEATCIFRPLPWLLLNISDDFDRATQGFSLMQSICCV